MAQHRRRDVRYAIQFPVQLIHAKRSVSLVTHDVSEGGIFLCTETPPPLLQLVKVQLVLPIGGRALGAHGMTVHVVEPGKGRVPGIGVQFYALDRNTREAWEAFTRHVQAHHPQSADQTPLSLNRGETPAPLSRQLGRHVAVLEVRPMTLERLEEVYTRDVATGGMFVPTPLELAPGAAVMVNVVHPETGAPFLFEAVVARRSWQPPGVGVELRGIDQRLREAFLDFVRGPIVIDPPDVDVPVEVAADAPLDVPVDIASDAAPEVPVDIASESSVPAAAPAPNGPVRRLTPPYLFVGSELKK